MDVDIFTPRTSPPLLLKTLLPNLPLRVHSVSITLQQMGMGTPLLRDKTVTCCVAKAVFFPFYASFLGFLPSFLPMLPYVSFLPMLPSYALF